MSFASDAAALDALVASILKRGLWVDVVSEGDTILAGSKSAVSIMTAVHAVDGPVSLTLRGPQTRRVGRFDLLLQDDPDCLIVDYPVNAVTETIWREWAAVGRVVF